MAANIAPIYTITPHIGIGQISTINTARDGSGTIVDILTGATNGTRVNIISITAIVTTTAGTVRLFISDGTNIRLWKEIPVSANTVSAINPAFSYTLELLGERALVLPSGWKLQATTEKGETFNVIARAGDY